MPLRAPGAGMTRLATALAPDARARLARAMLTDVVSALVAARVDEVRVAADGDRASDAAHEAGATVVLDPSGSHDLDAVLRAAASDLRGEHVLVVPADLPRLRADDVRAVLETPADVVVAPTAAGGTGGLLRRPVGRIPTAYGPDSARRHRELAERAGASLAIVDRDGFHHDVDTWTDLAALHEVELGEETARVLPQLLGRAAAVV